MAGNGRGDGDGEDIEDGDSLWAFVTRSIRPLRRERRNLGGVTLKPPEKPQKKKQAARQDTEYPASVPPPPRSPIPPAPPGAGLDRQTEKKLKRGQMAIDGRLDLHGLNREEAYEALGRFIHRMHDQGGRCVLVITGKGRGDKPGMLRQAVPQWLGQPPLAEFVLRTTTARPQHGGEGALYVLLRRKR